VKRNWKQTELEILEINLFLSSRLETPFHGVELARKIYVVKLFIDIHVIEKTKKPVYFCSDVPLLCSVAYKARRTVLHRRDCEANGRKTSI
jgi:hypothetical protein